MFYFVIHVTSLIVGLIACAIFSILNGIDNMAMLVLLSAVFYALLGVFELLRYKRKKQECTDGETYEPTLSSRIIFALLRAMVSLPIIYGFYNLTDIVAVIFPEFKYAFTIMFTILTLYTVVMDVLGAKAFKKYTVTIIQDNFIRGKLVTLLYYVQGTVSFLLFFSILDYLNLFS
jgi:hypothetical protein